MLSQEKLNFEPPGTVNPANCTAEPTTGTNPFGPVELNPKPKYASNSEICAVLSPGVDANEPCASTPAIPHDVAVPPVAPIIGTDAYVWSGQINASPCATIPIAANESTRNEVLIVIKRTTFSVQTHYP
jgi:hypothetical protein